uniref:Uncharacterized protein n=1 Tax=Eutreptiella gymnastica TaxID=73025 RepID=A0A7S4CGN5_9EUGL
MASRFVLLTLYQTLKSATQNSNQPGPHKPDHSRLIYRPPDDHPRRAQDNTFQPEPDQFHSANVNHYKPTDGITLHAAPLVPFQSLEMPKNWVAANVMNPTVWAVFG